MEKKRVINLIEGEISKKKSMIQLLEEHDNVLYELHSEVLEALEIVLDVYKKVRWKVDL